MRKAVLCFFVLFFLTGNTTYGQLKYWQTYTSSNHAKDFEETSQYYYFSTLGGLVRIKKADFSTEVLTKSNTPMFSSNFVGGLCKDSYDNLWTSSPAKTTLSTGGFLKFDGETWSSITPNFPPAYFAGVFGLTNDKNNNKWFGWGGAIAKYDGTNLFYREVISPLMPYGLMVRDIFFDSADNVWIHDDNGNIYALENRDMSLLKGLFRSYQISQDANDDLWILKNNKLKCFSPIANISILDYYDATNPPPLIDNLIYKDSIMPENPNDSITFFKINKVNNRFYVDFDNKLGVYENGNWQYHTLQNSNLPIGGSIENMFFASDGSIWINVQENDCWDGISRTGIFRHYEGQWTNMTRQLSNSGLHGNYIRQAALDRQSRKWIISWCNEKILTYFDGNTWSDIDSTSVSDLDAMFDIKYNSDTLKVWNDEALLIKYEPNTKRFAIFDNRKKQSSAMKTDADGYLWRATDNGLQKFNGATWDTYLAGNNIYALCFDHNNTLYANTLPEMGEKGMIFKITNSVVDTFATTTLPESQYEATWISSITVDNNNDLWFGMLWRQVVGYEYGGGMWHYNSRTQNLTPYHIYNSQIPGNSIVYVTTDVHNNVWVGTYNNGVGLFKNGVWTNFTSQNTPLSGTSVEIIMQDSNEDMWFVSQWNGINVVPYSVISKVEVVPTQQVNERIKVYPNPVRNNEITVEFNIGETGIFGASLYDIQGKLVFSTKEKSYPIGTHTEKITIPQQLSKGIYLMRIKIEDGIVMKKIIIE